uniref:Uncharacterized protein n=1 Tax=Chromera velia CCMP2878 TaxID=1169474 RepID=A0A0G4HGM1_9ALVE|eukprot:Cvel_27295.t1-p1 / transcript=Cvel_27295.t1 / gene=Cvel_27295 / organism=Chromera_velia_CCMP2878 / gene_product=hypothetical protein / transcript_product=hypothetical protein / location=Cvel_scaffold3383:15275-16048(+) / protein_length=139 / sequence_SO=supercontig / SO=protein_coding / is_pseudo=false
MEEGRVREGTPAAQKHETARTIPSSPFPFRHTSSCWTDPPPVSEKEEAALFLASTGVASQLPLPATFSVVLPKGQQMSQGVSRGQGTVCVTLVRFGPLRGSSGIVAVGGGVHEVGVQTRGLEERQNVLRILEAQKKQRA